jgi:hypothetical protein
VVTGKTAIEPVESSNAACKTANAPFEDTRRPGETSIAATTVLPGGGETSNPRGETARQSSSRCCSDELRGGTAIVWHRGVAMHSWALRVSAAVEA